MGAVSATIAAAGQHDICHRHGVATNTLITRLIYYILLKHSLAALANTLDGSTLCWIKRTH
jgi:hypothetical protein